MRLSDIRDEIAGILAYDPDTAGYNQILDRMIQAEADHLWTMHSGWTFAIKESTVSAYPDVVPTGTTTITATNGSAMVSCTSPLFETWMEGQVLVDPNGAEYTIKKVGATTAFILTVNYAGSTVTSQNFRVYQKRILLPRDCVKLMQVWDLTTNREILYRDRYNQDTTDLSFGISNPGDGEADYWIPMTGITVPPPVQAPKLTAIAGTASPGTYRVAYTYVVAGAESAMSPYATLKLSAPGGVRISIPNTTIDSGVYKRVYMAFAPASGTEYRAFRLITADLAETATIVDQTTPVEDKWIDNTAIRSPDHDGFTNAVRTHYRSDEKHSIQIRYLFRPSKLVEDNDSPQFPAANHHYLVYKVLEHVFVRHKQNTASQMYAKRAKEELQTLQRRYLDEERQDVCKGAAWAHNSSMPLASVMARSNTWNTTP